jgi:cysteine desulfurase
MIKPIYLDYHATTPVDHRVLEEMLPFLKNKYGNPSSIDHIYGNDSLNAVTNSREQIARLINTNPEDIIFTSGATEANNLALIGIAKTLEKGSHIITTSIEHKSILNTCKYLESMGYIISYLNVNKNGMINLDTLKSTITNKTKLISIMAANNEIGTIFPLKEIGKIAKKYNILFHTDAAQAFGHIPIDMNKMNINLMSISSHKMYGPKGIGALIVKRGINLKPLIYGGGQERGLRSGTLNVPAIVGFGKASDIAKTELISSAKHLNMLRTKLYKNLSSKVNIILNGSFDNRLTHNLSLYIPNVDAKALINEVKNDLALSSGSACTAENLTPSHVILALGHNVERAHATIRIGLGKYTTEKDIKNTVDILATAINKLRALN